jgi:hypothetical protein
MRPTKAPKKKMTAAEYMAHVNQFLGPDHQITPDDLVRRYGAKAVPVAEAINKETQR